MSAEENNRLQFPEIRIVEASAGSGKTYALARRYLQLLINPSLKAGEIPLRNILAITFTNKASVEMKERILEFLKKIALDAFSNPDEKNDILSTIGLTEKAAREKAFLVMDSIIRNYNYFQVQTIDSFIRSVVSGCAFSLGLSPRFQIKTDFSEYMLYGLDSLIEKAGKEDEIHGMFVEFLRRYLYIENKAGWLPKDNILKRFKELYNNSNTYGGEFRKTIDFSSADIINLKKNIFKLAGKLAETLPAGTNKTFAKSLTSLVERSPGNFGVGDLSRYFSREEFPVNKGKRVPEEINKLWDGIRFGIQDLCEKEAHSFFNCYIDIFNPVSESLRRAAGRKDIMFLSELNRQANTIFIEDSVSVPELYYRIAVRFRHFLIDEFQDTSELQWKNLYPLVDEVLASGGSLFYVGDKKQAIYRFRGGDATLFDRIPNYFGAYKPVREVLTMNYRSQKEVVEFNNEIFSESNLRSFISSIQEDTNDEEIFSESDMGEILGVFSESTQKFRPDNNGGYVTVRYIDAGTVEDRNVLAREELIKLVNDLRTRFSNRDIAVLARDNSDVELLTGWLIKEKIPSESEKTLNIRENPLVKEVLSFLMFLNSPIDDLSFASFIIGDIFSKAAGVSAETAGDFIFRLNQGRLKKTGGYLYREFRDAFPEIWEGFFEEFFSSVGFVPPYELVVSILAKFKVLENFSGHGVFLSGFLEKIKDYEEEGAGLGSFLDYFRNADDNDLFVPSSDSNSIKLLTIHKSKGLEFAAVIVPFLEMDISASGKGEGGGYEISSEKGYLSLVRVNRNFARFSPEIGKMYREKKKDSVIDELNTVYVALTRAKNELHILIPEKASKSNNPARKLLPENNFERGGPGSYKDSKIKNKTAFLDIPASSYSDWITLLKDEFVGGMVTNREAVMRGKFLHYALSFIGNISGKNKNSVVGDAFEKAKSVFPWLSGLSELKEVLLKTTDSESLRHIFYIEDASVYLEKEIVTFSGALKRIDRLVVTQNEVWVIDYKSSRAAAGGYSVQISDYMKLVEAIFPGRSVLGFVIFLDTIEIEKVV